MGRTEFYEAWCSLEQSELACGWLNRNPLVPELMPDVRRTLTLVRTWQALYPYKLFISPEFVIRSEECSICHQPTGPWSRCDHRPGSVYCGRLCTRLVKGMSLRGVSIVLEPVQKYSVLRIQQGDGSDQFDYRAVKWVRERVRSAFDEIAMRKTERFRPHDQVKLQSETDLCPCDSGRTYRSCCASLPGIRTPHMDVWFANLPAGCQPEYVYFGELSTTAASPSNVS